MPPIKSQGQVGHDPSQEKPGTEPSLVVTRLQQRAQVPFRAATVYIQFKRPANIRDLVIR